MKFIGQHIFDFIARFRNDVYLENLTTNPQPRVVGIDADGKLYKQDASAGDITSVVAGDALTGGGTIGDVTLNHEDTSTQASVNNTGTTFIQDVTLDTYGHVTGLTSTDVFNTTQQPVYINISTIPQAAMNLAHSSAFIIVPAVTSKTIVPLTIHALSKFNLINAQSRANLNFGYFINPTTPFNFTTGIVSQMRRFGYNVSTDYLALGSPQGVRAFSGTAANKPLAVSGEPGFAFTPDCFRDVTITTTYTLI